MEHIPVVKGLAANVKTAFSGFYPCDEFGRKVNACRYMLLMLGVFL